MKCENVRSELYDFIMGNLDDDRCREINSHLKSCEECRTARKELKESIDLLDSWQPPQVSDHFTENLMATIKKKRSVKQRSIKPWFLRPWLIPMEAAALLAIVFLVTIVSRNVFQPDEMKISRGLKIQLEITEIKNPIIIRSKNVDLSFIDLNERVKSYNGHIVERRRVDEKMLVIFYVEPDVENRLMEELKQTQNIRIPKRRFKDQSGNIVVVIKGKG